MPAAPHQPRLVKSFSELTEPQHVISPPPTLSCISSAALRWPNSSKHVQETHSAITSSSITFSPQQGSEQTPSVVIGRRADSCSQTVDTTMAYLAVLCKQACLPKTQIKIETARGRLAQARAGSPFNNQSWFVTNDS